MGHPLQSAILYNSYWISVIAVTVFSTLSPIDLFNRPKLMLLSHQSVEGFKRRARLHKDLKRQYNYHKKKIYKNKHGKNIKQNKGTF